MNTYRTYLLDTTDALNPTVRVVYIQAAKYGPAWEGARALCRGEVKQGITTFYDDEGAKEKAKITPGDHLNVAKIDNMKKRNVKLDKTALQAIINDPEATAEDKLEAMKAMIG